MSCPSSVVRCQVPARGFIGSLWRVVEFLIAFILRCLHPVVIWRRVLRNWLGTHNRKPATDHGRRTTDVFPMHPIPTKIKLAAGNDTLSINWSDGHASAYSYRYLRDRCPCASCSEGGGTHRQPSNLLPMLGVKPLKPERAELVGRYALQVFWNDGHSSGIYSFDYLRSLCPCPQCEVSGQV